jgi:hypothetical protein
MINLKVELPERKSFTPKNILPGNNICKINKIYLQQCPFENKYTGNKDGYYLILELETEPIGENFEGFLIDKNNESLGRFAGQTARVKYSEYPFQNSKTRSGLEINRNDELLRALNLICKETGCTSWIDDNQNNKFETIEEVFEAFNNQKPFENKWLRVCLGGREYLKGEYKAYDLFFPRFSKNGVPFESADTEKSNIAVFNEADHIKVKPGTNVEGDFNAEDNTGLSFEL